MPAHDFTNMNTDLIDRFGSAFSYYPDTGTVFQLRGIPSTGETAEARFPGTYFMLFATLADFPLRPQNGDTMTVPAGVPGVPAGEYRVAGVSEDDAGGGGIYLGFSFARI